MIRLTKVSDYGMVLLCRMAGSEPDEMHSSRGLADESGVPQPMVSKVLKALVRGDILKSHRGVKGGYSLARSPELITVAEIIAALEGPIELTECLSSEGGACEIECTCPTRMNWRLINDAICGALRGVTLLEMARPFIDQKAGIAGGGCPGATWGAEAGAETSETESPEAESAITTGAPVTNET